MGLENFQTIISTVSDIGKKFQEAKKIEIQKNNDFLNAKSTKSLIQYLNSIYKPEEIQQTLGLKDIKDYIKENCNDNIDKHLNTASTLSKIFKPELSTLIDDIKSKKKQINNPIALMNNISGMLSSSEEDKKGNNIKPLTDQFLLSGETEEERIAFLNQNGIPIITSDVATQPIDKKEEIVSTNIEKKQINAVVAVNIKEEENNKNIEITSESISKVKKVFEKYGKGGVPVKPEIFISLMNKYNIPLELGLAQAVIESNIGTSGGRPTKTKNIFNVGNVDDGSDKYMKTREEGVENYAKLLKEKYSNNEGVVDTQYLIKNGFKNKNGNKYASDSNYIEKLSKTIISINEIIA